MFSESWLVSVFSKWFNLSSNCLSKNVNAKWKLFYTNFGNTSFGQAARSSQSAVIWWKAAILVPVMIISNRTLRLFVSFKTIFIDLKLIWNWFNLSSNCLSNNDHANWILFYTNQRTNQRAPLSVTRAAVLAWKPGQALSWNPRHAATSKGMLVLESTTFLNFRVPDSTKSSNLACLCTVM